MRRVNYATNGEKMDVPNIPGAKKVSNPFISPHLSGEVVTITHHFSLNRFISC